MAPIAELEALLRAEPVDLARAALVVAKVETPDLDPASALARLDDLGTRAASRLAGLAGRPVREHVAALNHLLFEEERFRGNRQHYDDFRNSLLHVVLDRRLGIPISLAVVYIAVARRAGLDVAGICFPGHFLMRVAVGGSIDDGPAVAHAEAHAVLDPFDAGRELDDAACRALLARQPGESREYDAGMLSPCPPRQIVARMLNNLKRTYINMRSFPQAWRATELLIGIDPALDTDLRDRGLLAIHLQAWPEALRDLEDYLRRSNRAHDEDSDERERIWEHVTGLRRRLAAMN